MTQRHSPTPPTARPVNDLETGADFAPAFNAEGLVPAIAVDADGGRVLMMAWMNDDAIRRSLETGEAHYFSRRRQAIWRKGGTSGHVQEIVEIRTDCDQDTLLLRVRQHGPGACHVGYESCFYRRLVTGADGAVALETADSRSFDPRRVYGAGQSAHRKE